MKCLIIGEKVRFRPIVPWKVVLRPKLPKIPGKKASPRKKIFGPPNLKILSTSLMKGEVFRASPEKSSFRGPCLSDTFFWLNSHFYNLLDKKSPSKLCLTKLNALNSYKTLINTPNFNFPKKESWKDTITAISKMY